MKITQESIVINKGQPLFLGVRKISDGIIFNFAGYGASACLINIFERNDSVPAAVIELDNSYKFGEVFTCIVTAVKNSDTGNKKIQVDKFAKTLTDKYEYNICLDGKEYLDTYATRVCGRNTFGKPSNNVRCGFDLVSYDWSGEIKPKRPISENLIYQLHVRGYTKHRSSGVKHKGTFEGLIEKIPYIRGLGFNSIMLLPAYDFNEVMRSNTAVGIPEGIVDREFMNGLTKVNYWGYTTNCFYFAPKASYASKPWQCTIEFCDMVKAFHAEGIEIFMDMHFPVNYELGIILDCLRYWALKYHIDGFRVNNNAVPEQLVRYDAVLSSVKLISNYWSGTNNRDRTDYNNTISQNRTCSNDQIAVCNDSFMMNVRKYLKGDENQVQDFASHFQAGGQVIYEINYVDDINGFTLMDVFSYEQKHNRDNGENNFDGTDYNYSCNCGFEGNTKRKSVLALRIKQIKNVMILLFMSKGIPMLLAGDEFGNSQKGNNNAYCQDNEISWLDWKLSESNAHITDYLKMLIDVRKNTMKTYDITYHGMLAWSPDYHPYSRILGIMLNNKTDGIYIAINMHTETHLFELPRLMDGKCWSVLIASDTGGGIKEDVKEKIMNEHEKIMKYYVPSKSIIIFIRK